MWRAERMLPKIFITFFTLTTLIQAGSLSRPSCKEHYLHGNSRSGIYSLAQEDGQAFRVWCQMPESAEKPFQVGLTVRTALERWTTVGMEASTAGYQITDRTFFRQLIEPTSSCKQTVWVRWPYFNGNESESYFINFRSLSNLDDRIFWNGSLSEYEVTVNLSNLHAGLLHVIPSSPNNFTSDVRIKASPLTCQESAPIKKQCKFDLISPSDRVIGHIGTEQKTSFSFRTDQPKGRLLILESEGENVEVHLVDGYLIQIGQEIHTIGLLADAEWHTITWDRRNLQLSIDNYRPINVKIQATSIKITLNGQIMAIRKDYGEWLCKDSPSITSSLTQESNRKLCPATQPGFCHCKGPHSALSLSDSRRVECPIKPDKDTAFTFYRDPRKISFFYLPNYNEVKPISVLIKTDSNVGLIFFGQHNRSGVGLERFQVQYEGDYMTAGACSQLRKPEQNCISCSINKKQGFANNQWSRVTLFYNKENIYLTVDNQICQLSQETKKMDMADLYSMSSTVTSVLFVGSGTSYSKQLYQKSELINDHFRVKFFENTREKAPTLRGCVADLRIGGKSMDLHDVFEEQSSLIINDIKKMKEIFSMAGGCMECVKSECHGARCRIPTNFISTHSKTENATCDCADLFADKNPISGECQVSAKQRTTTKATALSLWRNGKSQMITYKSSFLKYSKLQKMWSLMRFPNFTPNQITLLDFGRVRVVVANYGKTVIIENMSGEREEFEIDPTDQRLHLIAVERNPSVGTNSADRSVTFRVDSDVRRISLDIFPIDEASETIIRVQKKEEGFFGGCISELSLAFDYDDSLSGLGPTENKVAQIEVLRELTEKNEKATNDLLMYDEACGIRDPTLWESKSNSLGLVGSYDPDSEYDFTWVLKIALVLLNMTAIMIILCVCTAIGICWYKNRKHVYKTGDRGYVSAEEYTKLFKEYGEEDTNSDDSIPHGIPPLDEKRPRSGSSSTKSPPPTRRVTFQTTPTSINV